LITIQTTKNSLIDIDFSTPTNFNELQNLLSLLVILN
jgi:hypothetical protein